MVSISREQFKFSGNADRDVQLICGNHVRAWISVFPPELVADDSHMDGVLRGVPLNVRDHPRSCHKKYNDDQDRNDCPCELYLIASIYLRGLPAIVTRSSSVLDNRVGQ